ncbi:MAG: glycosyltransferase family 2 protein [Lachnospiraceae bacterium]
MIKISVIMPVYNAIQYLPESIDSILNQSLKEFELILVDDGSSDGSSRLCDEYAEKDDRVVVIHQKNGGICNARNHALDIARGEYIAFADHDDLYLSGLLEDNYKIAEKYRAEIVKFGRESLKIDEYGKIHGKDVRNLKECFYDRESLEENYFRLRRTQVFSPVWDGLYQREFLEKYKIRFDENLKNYGEEDTVFCLKCIEYLQRFATSPGVYFKHFVRLKQSQSSKFHVLSLDKFVYSCTKEKEALLTFRRVMDQKEWVLSCVQNQLLSILFQLDHKDCNWSVKEKISYLKKMKNKECFSWNLSKEDWKLLWKKDKKKCLVAYLFETQKFRMLLALSKAYHKKVVNQEEKRV